MKHAIGIDKGTTNMAMAVASPGRDPVAVKNSLGCETTPSVLLFDSDGKCLVGEPAMNAAVLHPERVIRRVKTSMGCSDVIYTHPDTGEEITAPHAAALMLKKVKQDAEAALGAEVKEVVITVPAHASDKQKQNTIDAAKIAGLECLALEYEPVAAALCYAGPEPCDKAKYVLVVDLGGGTLDVTLVHIEGHELKVVSLSGDPHLGGDDFTGCIIERFREDLLRHNVTLDPVADASLLAMVLDQAQRAKHQLSTQEQVAAVLHLPTGPVKIELTRSEFEHMCSGLIERTRNELLKCVDSSGVASSDIKEVVFAGGSMRMPWASELVAQLFPHTAIKRTIDPDTAIAKGAAIRCQLEIQNRHGGTLPPSKTVLRSICPACLGVEVVSEERMQGGADPQDCLEFSTIIPAGNSVPTEAFKDYSLLWEGQDCVEVVVCDRFGEDQWQKVCDMEMTISPGGPADNRVRVSFKLDSSGCFSAEALDLHTGRKVETQCQWNRALSEQEVSKAQKALSKKLVV